MSDADPALPQVGSEITVPVVASPSRMTILPELAVIASPVPGMIELIFLRNELTVPVHSFIVGEGGVGGAVMMNPGAAQVTPQLTDIGHVRLPVNTAVELAALILAQARDQQGFDIQESLSRLSASRPVAKLES